MQTRTETITTSGTCLDKACPQPNDAFTVVYEREETTDPTTNEVTVVLRGIRDATANITYQPRLTEVITLTRRCPWCNEERQVRVAV